MNIKKIFKLTPTHTINPELNKIRVKNGNMYATDGFIAIIAPAPEEYASKEGYISNSGMFPFSEQDTSNYPDFQPIMDKAEHQDYITIPVNRKYLIDLLEAMDKTKDGDQIKIKVCTSMYHMPIILENKNATGLIMPLNK